MPVERVSGTTRMFSVGAGRLPIHFTGSLKLRRSHVVGGGSVEKVPRVVQSKWCSGVAQKVGSESKAEY
jgi:hypothetical protein